MAKRYTKQIDLSTFGGGRNKLLDADKIGENQAQIQNNVECSDGKFFNSKGDVIHGSQISATIPITGLSSWDGNLIAFCGTKMYIKTEDWYEFASGFTTGTEMDFLEYYDDLYYMNGTDASGRAVKTTLTSDVTAGAATINVDYTGKFSSSGTIYINGDAITYTGKTDTTFTGCSGALAHDSGDIVIQTSEPSDIPLGQFIEEYGNKAWVSGIDATTTIPTQPWRLYYSVTALASIPANFYDFTSAGSGQEFIANGGKITALLKFKNNLLISKTDEIEYIAGFDDTTTPPAPIRQQFFRQDGAVNYKCMVATKNDVIYFTGKRFKRLFTPSGYAGLDIDPEFDDPVVDILEALDDDQSSACMIYNPDNYTLTLSCKSEGSAYNDVRINYDTKRKYWYTETNKIANCYTVLKGVTYYGNGLVGEVREDNQSYTINGAGYNSTRLSREYTLGDKNKIKEFMFFHIGGKITTNTSLTLRIYVDNILVNTEIIDSDNIDNKVSEDGSFGNAVFGNQTFGGGSEPTGLYNFYDIYPIGVRGKNFSYQIDTAGTGQQYEINSVGISVQAKKDDHREPTT